jgi:putative MFS transporter
MATKNALHWTIAVAALGYFVDIYDLQLFNIVSKSSLSGIGISDPIELERWDYLLFLWQMGGMLVGGLLWGWLGDTKGRKNILFGSILLYSLANIANAFVYNVETYSAIRFIAGLGLAGELGAAITLVSELMDKEKRGYGTMVIVTMGALGAVAAVLISKIQIHFFHFAPWQISYLVGGTLGLLLLVLRMGTFESGTFEKIKSTNIRRGNFLMLFSNKERALRYLACIAIGLPVWYSVGILIKFSKKFAALQGLEIEISHAIVFTYLGLSFGDLLSSILSQFFKSRKKTVFIYLSVSVLVIIAFLFFPHKSGSFFYGLCFMIGTATGYWALFVSMSAELFGTNIRATVASTTPNFVRGAVVPLVLTFKAWENYIGMIPAAAILGVISLGLAFWGIAHVKESFGKDLDFQEN